MKNILLIILLQLLLISCFEEDKAVTPFDRGSAISGTTDPSNVYKETIYYNLQDNEIVAHHDYSIWDIAFDCSDTTHHIILNSAKFVIAGDMGEQDFESFSLKSDDNLWHDVPSGNLDSTAIGTWWKEENGEILSLNHTYLLNLGSNSKGALFGYAKFIIDSLKDNKLYFRYARIKKNAEIQYAVLSKNSNQNFVYYSFIEDKIIDEIPSKDSWDIKFTPYTEFLTLDGEIYPYPVKGCILNSYNTFAIDVPDSSIEYSEHDPLDLLELELSNEINVIGYDWKQVDTHSSTAVYTVNHKRSYVIQTQIGFKYKFHFIDYYDTDGNRGAPSFEYEIL